MPSTTSTGVARVTTLLDAYRKFLPQVAYVLLAGWTLLADRLGDGKTIDGVTAWAILIALVQAIAVVAPTNPVVKAVLSLIMAITQAVTALLVGPPSAAEFAVVIGAFLSWAASAHFTNLPAGRVVPGEVVAVVDTRAPQR